MKVWEVIQKLSAMPAGKDIVIVRSDDSELSLDIMRIEDNEPGEDSCAVILVTRNSPE